MKRISCRGKKKREKFPFFSGPENEKQHSFLSKKILTARKL